MLNRLLTKLVLILVVTYPTVNGYGQISSTLEKGAHFSSEKYIEAKKRFYVISKKPLDELSEQEQFNHYITGVRINIEKQSYSRANEFLIKAKQLKLNESSEYIYNTVCTELFSKMKAYHIAIQYEKKLIPKTNKWRERAQRFSNIGTKFIISDLPDSALVYFRLEKKECKNSKDPRVHAYVNYDFAHVYLRIDQYDKALEYSFKGINQLKQLHSFNATDSLLYNDLLGNIGLSYVAMERYEEAIPYLEVDVRKWFTMKLYRIHVATHVKLVRAYLKVGNLKRAREVEQLLLGIQSEMSPLAETNLRTLQLSIALYEGNQIRSEELLAEWQVAHRKFLQTEQRLLRETNGVLADLLVSDSKIKLQLKERENAFNRSVLWFVSGLFLSAIYLGYVIVKNRRRKERYEKELFQLREEQLNLQLKAQENNLVEFAIDFQKKREERQSILDNLVYLKSVDETSLKQEIDHLIQEFRVNQHTESHLNELGEQSQVLLLQFKNNLLLKHPNLTKTEIELCMLVKLNASNKEISNARNITLESVKNLKNRLKKKLGLTNEDSLTHYVGGIT